MLIQENDISQEITQQYPSSSVNNNELIQKTKNLINSMKGLHYNFTMDVNVGLFGFNPPENYKEAISSFQNEYDKIQNFALDSLAKLMTGIQELEKAINTGIITNELYSVSENIYNETIEKQKQYKALQNQLMKLIETIWERKQQTGKSAGILVRKNIDLDVSKVSKEDILNEIKDNAVKQAKANPLLIGGMILSIFQLLKHK